MYDVDEETWTLRPSVDVALFAIKVTFFFKCYIVVSSFYRAKAILEVNVPILTRRLFPVLKTVVLSDHRWIINNRNHTNP